MPDKVQPSLTINPQCTIHKIPVLFKSPILRFIVFNILLIINFLFEITKNAKPDMIYARQIYSGIIPILFSRIFRISYFSEINNIIPRSKLKTYYLKTKIKIVLERLSLKLANFIITPSLTLKNGIVERYGFAPDKIHVVPNGVNEKIFYPSFKKCCLCENFGIKNNDFIVGFVGSMAKWQGLNILKNAIIKALDSNNKIKFLLVGDYVEDSNHDKMKAGSGDAAENILSFIKDHSLEGRVIYHGFVNYEATADFMNICDVLLAPYTSECHEFGGGSPMKLYAYFGCGKPVIISDLGEFTDSISLKKRGAAYLIPPDDSDALAKAILYFKKNKTAVKKYGERGRTFVLNERKWSDSCSKILSILHQ